MRLKLFRAITLCCTAKSANSAASRSRAVCQGIEGWASRVFGTAKLPINPIAYKNTARNVT
jgi:hypothetical protein